MRNCVAIALALFALVWGTGELKAQDEWSHEFTPSFWYAGADGDVFFDTTDGAYTISFDDLFRMEVGMAARVQGQGAKWGYLIDGSYGRNAIGDQDSSLGTLAAAATYQLSERSSFVNLVFGVKYSSSTGGIRVIDPDEPDPQTDDEKYMKVSGTGTWADFMVGIQVTRPFGNRMGFDGYFDVSAGQGNVSYQAAAGLSWDVSPKLAVKAGYRLVSADYDDDTYDVDILFGGFYGGLGVKF